MNVQNKKFELGTKYFSEINTKNNFFTNYNDNSNIDYEHFLVPLRCALYVLEDNDKKEDKENEKNVIKKRITFSKNNNISNKKEKIEVVNKYDKKEKIEINLENNELKREHIIKKYNKFVNMILFIVEKNYDTLNNDEKIYLLNLFNDTDKEKYFKMLCTKENDYNYWKQFDLDPPMIKISKLLEGKINIVNKNPYTIYFEKCV